MNALGIRSFFTLAILALPLAAQDKTAVTDDALSILFTTEETGGGGCVTSPFDVDEDGVKIAPSLTFKSMEALEEKGLIRNMEIAHRIIKESKTTKRKDGDLVLEIPASVPLKRYIQEAIDVHGNWAAVVTDSGEEPPELTQEEIEFLYVPCPLTMKGTVIRNQLLLRFDAVLKDPTKLGKVTAADVDLGKKLKQGVRMYNAMKTANDRIAPMIRTHLESLDKPPHDLGLVAGTLCMIPSAEEGKAVELFHPFFKLEDGTLALDPEDFVALKLLHTHGLVQNMDVLEDFLKACQTELRDDDFVLAVKIPEKLALDAFVAKAKKRVDDALGANNYKKPKWAAGPNIPLLTTKKGEQVKADIRKAYKILVDDVFKEEKGKAAATPKGKATTK